MHKIAVVALLTIVHVPIIRRLITQLFENAADVSLELERRSRLS
jgi:hypothetical protein